MDDPGPVGDTQGRRHLAADAGGGDRLETSLRGDDFLEGSAADKHHHQAGQPLVDDDVVDGDRVGMVQPGGEAGLTHRPPDGDLASSAVTVRKPLNGDITLQQAVAGASHLAHAPSADQFDALVATADHPAGVARVHPSPLRARSLRGV